MFGGSFQSQAKTDCPTTFRKLSRRLNPFAPQINLSKIFRELNEDSRKAILKLATVSKVIDDIDNFSAAATQQIIFSDKLSKESLKLLNAIRDEPAVTSLLLKKDGRIFPDSHVAIIDALEERFRLAAEIVNARNKSLTGISLAPAEYTRELRTFLENSLSELSSVNGGEDLSKMLAALRAISEKDFQTKYLSEVKPDKLMRFSISASELKPDLLRADKEPKDFAGSFRDVSRHISSELAALPVGLSYQHR